MRYYRIPNNVRLDAERVLRRYPQNKKILKTLDTDVILATHPGESKGNSTSDNKPQSVTEGKALQLMSPYYDRLRREVAAVEYAMSDLNDMRKQIIEIRYFGDKKIGFNNINLPYAPGTMRHITSMVLFRICYSMGYLRGE